MRLRYKILAFGLVGGGATLIDWAVFNVFFFLGAYFSFAIAMGWILSMVFNFMVNRNWTFSARGRAIGTQIVKWLMVYALAFLARLLLSNLLLSLLGEGAINANIAFIGGLAISIPISFLGSLLWAFNNKKI